MDVVGQALGLLGQVDVGAEVPGGPFLTADEFEEALQAYQAALAGGRRQRPATPDGLTVAVERPRLAQLTLVAPQQIAVNLVDGRDRGVATGEVAEVAQIVGVLRHGALAAVAIDLKPGQVLLDRGRERRGHGSPLSYL